MKFDLNDVHAHLKSGLKYQQEEYLPYLKRMLKHENEEYRVFAQEKIPDCERLIQYYATELEQTNIEQTLLLARLCP